MIAGRRPDYLALGGDHLGVHEVVGGQPVFAHQPADVAAQAEAADAGVTDDAARGSQAVRLCLVVDISPQGTARTRAVRSTGSTETARIADRSITIPPSHTACRRRCDPRRERRSRDRGGGRSAPLRPHRRCRCSGQSTGGRRSTVPLRRLGRRRSRGGRGRSRCRNPGNPHRRWLNRSSSGRWAHRTHRDAARRRNGDLTSKKGIWTSRRSGGDGQLRS